MTFTRFLCLSTFLALLKHSEFSWITFCESASIKDHIAQFWILHLCQCTTVSEQMIHKIKGKSVTINSIKEKGSAQESVIQQNANHFSE